MFKSKKIKRETCEIIDVKKWKDKIKKQKFISLSAIGLFNLTFLNLKALDEKSLLPITGLTIGSIFAGYSIVKTVNLETEANLVEVLQQKIDNGEKYKLKMGKEAYKSEKDDISEIAAMPTATSIFSGYLMLEIYINKLLEREGKSFRFLTSSIKDLDYAANADSLVLQTSLSLAALAWFKIFVLSKKSKDYDAVLKNIINELNICELEENEQKSKPLSKGQEKLKMKVLRSLDLSKKAA